MAWQNYLNNLFNLFKIRVHSETKKNSWQFTKKNITQQYFHHQNHHHYYCQRHCNHRHLYYYSGWKDVDWESICEWNQTGLQFFVAFGIVSHLISCNLQCSSLLTLRDYFKKTSHPHSKWTENVIAKQNLLLTNN